MAVSKCGAKEGKGNPWQPEGLPELRTSHGQLSGFILNEKSIPVKLAGTLRES